MNETFFLLLQINDAAFPIGGYAHSYGLETYIQHGLVHDVQTAETYLKQNLKYSFLYSELLSASLAFDRTLAADLSGILQLDLMAQTARTPIELRQAALKLGNRFLKTAGELLPDSEILHTYQTASTKKATHGVAYGVFCAAAGIPKQDAMGGFLYSQCAAMVTCCVKTIPLSQTDGQRILTGAHGLMQSLLYQLEVLEEKDLFRSCPGLEIRAMQHERLYSRLYMS